MTASNPAPARALACIALAFFASCAPTPASAPPEPPATAEAPAVAPSPAAGQSATAAAADVDAAAPLASADASVGPTRGPTVTIHTRTDLPLICNKAQTNTPCIYKTGAGCRLRRMNCEHLPCTESAPPAIECDRSVPAMKAPSRVCLEVTPLPHDATIAVFKNDANSEVVAGPLGDETSARVCGDADRFWKINVNDGTASFDADVDWRRASCFVVDLAARRASAPCKSSAARSYEHRL